MTNSKQTGAQSFAGRKAEIQADIKAAEASIEAELMQILRKAPGFMSFAEINAGPLAFHEAEATDALDRLAQRGVVLKSFNSDRVDYWMAKADIALETDLIDVIDPAVKNGWTSLDAFVEKTGLPEATAKDLLEGLTERGVLKYSANRQEGPCWRLRKCGAGARLAETEAAVDLSAVSDDALYAEMARRDRIQILERHRDALDAEIASLKAGAA